MKVLIVGGGGREHALAWRVRQDQPGAMIYAAPGNPGIAELAQCVSLGTADIDALVAFATRENIDLTIVGPEAPLAAGIVDRFRAAHLAVFGPTQAAAEIETSKAFAKQLMHRGHIPTARAVVVHSLDEAERALPTFGLPVVIKASGLAAGKGVVIATSLQEAREALASMLGGARFGDAGTTVVIEEFMEGEELSLFCITDGTRALPLIAAQDHKRLLDGDAGPNTGGMGAYAPVSLAQPHEFGRDAGVVEDAVERIVLPTLATMRAEGRPFAGLLYAGLMLTADGPRVVEFNCRFGDPETEAVLPILDCSPALTEVMLGVARGEPLADARVRARRYAVTTVLASAGYPDAPRTGDVIHIPTPPDDVLVFHAGTKRRDDGALVTAGGRVLAITGVGASFADAQRASRDFAERVQFEGKQFRGDIGWREQARRAGAP